MGYSGDQGKLIHEENLKTKTSSQTPDVKSKDF
jgi:hypothetical protein